MKKPALEAVVCAAVEVDDGATVLVVVVVTSAFWASTNLVKD